ncbi:MAG: lysophospholipid acyltransferase family protein [Spartobacteria bacterium]
MTDSRRWFHRFAVRGVLWRHYLDFGLTNVPFYLRPVMIFFWTILFFFLAAPARRAILSNLRVILPGSSPLLNQARAWLTLYNFAWTISDAADHKLAKTEFAYEVEGAEFLDQLAAAKGAILLTAHMGNYDLGAAIFAERFQRHIRMVRAPEADAQTAQHLDQSLERAGAGAVKVAYNTSSMALPFELLHAIRAGEIVSIQGDRAVANVSQRPTRLFGENVQLPDGPFMLAFVTQAPIHPLFVVRTSFHRYKILALEPIHCRRDERGREAVIEEAMQTWSRNLERVIAAHWSQWFSLVPIFLR